MSGGIDLDRELVVSGVEEVYQTPFKTFVDFLLLWWFASIVLNEIDMDNVFFLDQFLPEHPESGMSALEDRVDTSVISFSGVVSSH